MFRKRNGVFEWRAFSQNCSTMLSLNEDADVDEVPHSEIPYGSPLLPPHLIDICVVDSTDDSVTVCLPAAVAEEIAPQSEGDAHDVAAGLYSGDLVTVQPGE